MSLLLILHIIKLSITEPYIDSLNSIRSHTSSDNLYYYNY